MNLFEDVEFVKSVFDMRDLPKGTYPEIAFAGRSNVGKSSLLNRIFNKKGIAKVSATPGHTRSLNYFFVDKRFYFVDLPGYGYAKVSDELKRKWQYLMENYLKKRQNLRAVLCIFDVRREPDELDMDLLNFLSQNGKGIIIVLNKTDKLNNNELQKNFKRIENIINPYSNIIFSVSAKTSHGIHELKKYLYFNILKEIKMRDKNG